MGDDLTFEQILEMLKGKYAKQEGGGVMDRGFDNEYDRKFLNKYMADQGLMDAAATEPPLDVMQRDYDFDVDGKTEGYTFTGDAAPSEKSIQRMRTLQGITADGSSVSNLGMGGSATHTMPDGTVMPGATHGEYNTMGGMSTAAGQGGVDRNTFNQQFGALDDLQKRNVVEIMSGMTPEQKETFARGLTNSPLSGFAVQDEMLDYTRRGGSY